MSDYEPNDDLHMLGEFTGKAIPGVAVKKIWESDGKKPATKSEVESMDVYLRPLPRTNDDGEQ